jgi:hypothetical protein
MFTPSATRSGVSKHPVIRASIAPARAPRSNARAVAYRNCDAVLLRGRPQLTSATLAASTNAPTELGSHWRARSAEFMAVGGATLVLFPLAILARSHFGLDSAEFAVGFVMAQAAHFINDPHFSVTYLLFYRNYPSRAFGADGNRAQRVRYVVAGLVVPALLVTWAALGLVFHAAQALGWMIQLMFLLVGWHYAKQGFGVLTVLSARRAVFFNAQERRVILGHCYAAWAFSWANPVQAAGEFEEKGVVYWGPAHPRWLELATGSVLAVSTLLLVVIVGMKWRREKRLPFAPLTAFLATIWLWTIYTALDPLVRYVIPALHSVQYMYFVWLMKRNEARACEGPPLFGPPTSTRLTALAVSALLLGWVLLRAAPSGLDVSVARGWSHHPSTQALGETPFFAAFFVIVNIHHYFMDNVIWRRDNPDTQYLREPTTVTT